jgi:hypothetical protein
MALVHALTSFDRTNLETCTDGSFADSLDTATVELAVHFDKSTPAVDFLGKAEIFSSGATLASPAWWNLWSLRSVEERRSASTEALDSDMASMLSFAGVYKGVLTGKWSLHL